MDPDEEYELFNHEGYVDEYFVLNDANDTNTSSNLQDSAFEISSVDEVS